MLMFEAGAFQWRPAYRRFGGFRRLIIGCFAITYCEYGFNEMIIRVGRAGASVLSELTSQEVSCLDQ